MVCIANGFIINCQDKIMAGGRIDSRDAYKIMNAPPDTLHILSDSANKITRKFHGKKVDIEQLSNIKKIIAAKIVHFVANLLFFDTNVSKHNLLSTKKILQQIKNAVDNGAKSYCLVAAWRQPPHNDFTMICNTILKIKEYFRIEIECSLGFLTLEQAKKLKSVGVKRYNHNLETARSKFSDICTTHTYDDRINTLLIAKKAGLELCTGGILGIGETREQRLELVIDIAKIQPEEVTINLLVAIPGTPLEFQKPLSIGEILRTFAVIRFLLPRSIIKISGGREINLNDDGEKLLLGGANGIISSGYLTINGNSIKDDLKMIKKLGLEV